MTLLLCLIVALILIAYSRRRYGTLFNPFTLEIYIIMLFLIVPQLLKIQFLDEKAYLYSDLTILTYIVGVFVGTHFGVKIPPIKPLVNTRAVNLMNTMLYGLMILPLVYYYRDFEISIAGIRAFYESVVFTPYASLFELSKILLFFIILMRILRTRKLDLLTLVMMSVILLYGSKYALFDLIVLLFVFFDQYGKLTIRRFAIWGFVAGSLLVGYKYYQTIERDRSTIFKTAIDYFDLYQNQTLVIERIVEGGHDYYYGRIYFSSYLRYIPRAIWTTKPRAFGSAILNYELFPEYAERGYMPAFGLAPAFADFGFFSVFGLAFFAGFLRNMFYSMFLRSRTDINFMLFAFPVNFVTTFFVFLQLLFDRIIQSMKSPAKAPESPSTDVPGRSLLS